MPQLDVTSVLTDPMFATRNLSCIRQTQTIDNHGHAINTPTPIPFSGVVTQNSGDSIRRTDSGSRIEGDIVIHTRFSLTDGKNGRDADKVKYLGNLYLISNVADWSTYGRGFVAATATLVPLSGGK